MRADLSARRAAEIPRAPGRASFQRKEPTTVTNFLLAPISLLAALLIAGSFFITIHRRRQRLDAGTAPANFPPDPYMQVGGVQAGNKLGNTGAITSTVFFTAPITGYYWLSWAIHINVTDAAGSLTATFTPPNSVAIPGVQAAPATPSDGKGPGAAYYMAAGSTVTGAVTVSGLTGTNFDAWLFALRLS